MARRLLALLCAFVIAACTLPALALAEGGNWADHADTGWYDKDKSAKEFEISTAEQLAGLAKLVNDNTADFSNKTVRLTKDIDLSGKEWTPIGGDESFFGAFDGGGHVVKNLRTSIVLGGCSGLFGCVGRGSAVRNLGVEKASVVLAVPSKNGAGLLVGQAFFCTIENCYATGSIVSTYDGIASVRLGGLVGYSFDNHVKISDCWFKGDISARKPGALVGGIVGMNQPQFSLAISNCAVFAGDLKVAGSGKPAWIVVGNESDVTMKDCRWPEAVGQSQGLPPARGLGGGPLAGGSWTPDVSNKAFSGKDELLSDLKAHAGEGVKWVEGIDYPTFDWDKEHIPANCDALEAAVKKAKEIRESDYTEASLSAFKTALEAAQKLLAEKPNAKRQEEVSAKSQALEKAMDALVYRPADYSALDAAVKKAEGLKESDYVDFSGVSSALEAAKAVERGLDVTHQTEIDRAKDDLVMAIGALVYRPASYADLDAVIKKAEKIREGDYTEESLPAFKAALAAARALARDLDVTQQPKVDRAKDDLVKAMAALVYKPADYEALDAAIEKAEGLKESDYRSGYPEVKAALAAAKALSRDLNVTQQPKVDKAKDDLVKAMAALVYKPADYEALDAAIEKAEGLKESDYKSGFPEVKAALEAARALARDLDVTQQPKVDRAKDDLVKAMDALVRVYPPAVDQPSGTGQSGAVTVNPQAPKAGDKVTVKIVPPAGKAVDKVTVTDEAGKEIPVTRNADGTYTFVQPKGKVTVKVAYKDASGGYAPSVSSDDYVPATPATANPKAPAEGGKAKYGTESSVRKAHGKTSASAARKAAGSKPVVTAIPQQAPVEGDKATEKVVPPAGNAADKAPATDGSGNGTQAAGKEGGTSASARSWTAWAVPGAVVVIAGAAIVAGVLLKRPSKR